MGKSKDRKEKKNEEVDEEMKEITEDDDTHTIYSDSGHASDTGSIHSDDVESGVGDGKETEIAYCLFVIAENSVISSLFQISDEIILPTYQLIKYIGAWVQNVLLL